MTFTELLLGAIAVLLFLILLKIEKIDSRLKTRFPTKREEDLEWAKNDPEGHYNAHK